MTAEIVFCYRPAERALVTLQPLYNPPIPSLFATTYKPLHLQKMGVQCRIDRKTKRKIQSHSEETWRKVIRTHTVHTIRCIFAGRYHETCRCKAKVDSVVRFESEFLTDQKDYRAQTLCHLRDKEKECNETGEVGSFIFNCFA